MDIMNMMNIEDNNPYFPEITDRTNTNTLYFFKFQNQYLMKSADNDLVLGPTKSFFVLKYGPLMENGFVISHVDDETTRRETNCYIVNNTRQREGNDIGFTDPRTFRYSPTNKNIQWHLIRRDDKFILAFFEENQNARDTIIKLVKLNKETNKLVLEIGDIQTDTNVVLFSKHPVVSYKSKLKAYSLVKKEDQNLYTILGTPKAKNIDSNAVNNLINSPFGIAYQIEKNGVDKQPINTFLAAKEMEYFKLLEDKSKLIAYIDELEVVNDNVNRILAELISGVSNMMEHKKSMIHWHDHLKNKYDTLRPNNRPDFCSFLDSKNDDWANAKRDWKKKRIENLDAKRTERNTIVDKFNKIS